MEFPAESSNLANTPHIAVSGSLVMSFRRRFAKFLL
jgi:hypothetical protein